MYIFAIIVQEINLKQNYFHFWLNTEQYIEKSKFYQSFCTRGYQCAYMRLLANNISAWISRVYSQLPKRFENVSYDLDAEECLLGCLIHVRQNSLQRGNYNI